MQPSRSTAMPAARQATRIPIQSMCLRSLPTPVYNVMKACMQIKTCYKVHAIAKITQLTAERESA